MFHVEPRRPFTLACAHSGLPWRDPDLGQEEDHGGCCPHQSFTDTETGKDLAEQIVGGEFTGDSAKVVLREFEFFGQQL